MQAYTDRGCLPIHRKTRQVYVMEPRTTFRAVIVALLLLHATSSAAQGDRSRVMGTVMDTSGGALPGVTVTLIGSSIASTPVVTDGSGRYLTPWVAPGTYNISFELSGFDTRKVNGIKLGAGQTVVLDQQLPLAQFSETVEVSAPAPPPPPAPKPPPPARPKLKPVEGLLASVCGPREAPEFSLAKGKIVSHRDDPGRQLLGPGDYLRIDAGEKEGFAVGENFVVRRRFQTGDRFAPKRDQKFGEQTAGLVQITEVQGSVSTAIVVYACGEIYAGDSIEPYVAQPASYAVPGGKPRFDDPAHIKLGEYDRSAASAGQMMVIDRGVMQNVQRGQLVTIFRQRPGQSPLTIGTGVIVSVRPDSATLRIDYTTDAISVGDLVALHK